MSFSPKRYNNDRQIKGGHHQRGLPVYRQKTMTLKSTILESTITCPYCGHRETETMPTNACQFFYDCKQCGFLLKPKVGDCCVFCSYGSVKCPPIQQQNSCCSP